MGNAQGVICTYHYDPLDRLVSTSTDKDAKIARFYRKNRLATEIQGSMVCTIFQLDVLPIAQRHLENHSATTSLLATDHQHSILYTLRSETSQSDVYSPYGHSPVENGVLNFIGFKGERRDSVTGHYLLGNGYRAFNPILMRFNSPDSFSPFGRGGVNTLYVLFG